MGDRTRVLIGGLVAAVVAGVLGLLLVTSGTSTYRAQVRMAVLPSAEVPPDQVPSFWEALGQGQVPRTAAEIFGSSQWIADAARATEVAPSTVELSAGVVPGTSLIEVTLEADSPEAAERSLEAAVNSALPLASLASGPYTMVRVSGPEGTAVRVGAPAAQTVPLMAAAGFLFGAGTLLLITRRHQVRAWIGRRGLRSPETQQSVEQGPTQQGPTQQGPTQQGPTQQGPTQQGCSEPTTSPDPRPTPQPRPPADATASGGPGPRSPRIPVRRVATTRNGSTGSRPRMWEAPTTSIPKHDAPEPCDEDT
jgi:hypothetical protein